MGKSTNVTWHDSDITREQREAVLGQRGCTIWMTGLSGSGKSTVAVAVEKLLIERGRAVYRLDGDNVRHGLCGDLGFSAADREENNRRIGEVTRLMADAGLIVFNSFVSPFRATRDMIRKLHDDAGLPFLEVFVHVPLEVAEQRDPKGLYRKARAGAIPDFTGISSPFEEPASPELVLPTHELPIEACAQKMITLLQDRGIIRR